MSWLSDLLIQPYLIESLKKDILNELREEIQELVVEQLESINLIIDKEAVEKLVEIHGITNKDK